MPTTERISLVVPDGGAFIGASFQEVEEQLRAAQWHTYPTRADFRRDVMRRAGMWSGRPETAIGRQSSETFIHQLADIGEYLLVEERPDNEHHGPPARP
jgi:hypothetical protein